MYMGPIVRIVDFRRQVRDGISHALLTALGSEWRVDIGHPCAVNAKVNHVTRQ